MNNIPWKHAREIMNLTARRIAMPQGITKFKKAWAVPLCILMLVLVLPAGAGESLLSAQTSIAGERGSGADEDRFASQREQMVEQQIAGRGIDNSETLEAMRNVPRHLFVRSSDQRRAYSDGPMPIGHGQTISQPYIVAYMTQLIEPKPDMNVLEIGTGSGYQAAVLAEITDNVFTIEIIGDLAEWGGQNLQEAGYDHVQVKHADGYYGWEEHAPFDAIVVTAAADHIPSPLVEQLKDGGRMIIPVGSPFQTQNLMLVQKDGDDVRTRNLMPVRFVPFTREEE
ncbi:protein-L-isoaspartate(D-aspartate) O-methyltransferase [Natronogracilivirga saccharolytica]|uniref:Protein-L-isoaspartate O-methyltransferase n=1 Tax=Natronogracilivirga saccharolytica TaxID=2812953 RepID=A0A8J7SBH9_9BACT|nr:protein-L-isoaspartate(D-aspartate) O-methyltransferase [Natronogracilivirga saccharolytica]MBP3193271.1 protein-L-isoaspartate(D-aspartate) O-methyltransferase [Natronogracilivirga saccharolytica]